MFFTLDLSNPKKPTVIGELKIPGFSTYMHPIDQNHLLTIGEHLPEPDENGRVDWSQRAVKLSIFDVTNFAKPKEKFTHKLGGSSGSSEARWDHKAFNYFAERGLLSLPYSEYEHAGIAGDYWSRFTSEVRVFKIDLKAGILPRGTLSMNDVYRQHARDRWSWYYTPHVRRSVMATDQAGKDFVYGISDAGIRVAALGALSTPVATAYFPLQTW